jgi:hypothetical protein
VQRDHGQHEVRTAHRVARRELAEQRARHDPDHDEQREHGAGLP